MKINKQFCLNCIIFLYYFLLINGKTKSTQRKGKRVLKEKLDKNPSKLENGSKSYDDRNLQITGDGNIYDYKQILVSEDGGKTLKLLDAYVKVKDVYGTQKGIITKEDISPPSAKIEGIGAIFAIDDDNDQPKLYRLREQEYFIFDIIESTLHLIRGPIPLSHSEEKFPTGLTAAVNIGKGFYLFFRNDKFCRRKLIVENTDSECPNGFKNNSLLFGCKNAKQESHKDLCENLNINGAALLDNRLFLFRGQKYWIFNDSTHEYPGHFDSEYSSASQMFDGFVEVNDGITSIGKGKESKLIMFNNNKLWIWSSDGKVVVSGNQIVGTKGLESNSVYGQIRKAEPKTKTDPKNEPKIKPITEIKNTINQLETSEQDSKSADKSYPSEKDGTYGTIIQLNHNPEPKFARLRGREVYYFYKKGQTFEFTGEWMPIHKNKKKLPPDINAVFKGLDERYYFIREDNYCRRPLNVSGMGLDPPDYCPEGGDVRELLGCNIRFYPPDVDELCHNPMIDNTVVNSEGKNVYLFRESNYWILMGLPANASFSPSKCYITFGGDATKTWTDFSPRSDALFTMESGMEAGRLIQFNQHRYTLWNIKGGPPLQKGLIIESPIKSQTTVKPVVTEKPETTTTETIIKQENIIYSDENFKNLCLDPIIDSADSNLNGSEILIFKKSRYYVLNGLREGKYGKLVESGLIVDLYDNFETNSTTNAVMNCKEGYRRGFFFQFFEKTLWSSWDIQKRPLHTRESMTEITTGLDAVLHNRNVTDPVMIGLIGEDVHYFTTAGQKFARKRRQVKYHESLERLPPNVSAAFSMPNGIIYLFRGQDYCVRQLFYTEMPPYCPKWRDNRKLFGCFGDKTKDEQKTEKKGKLFNDLEALSDLCSNLKINDADRLLQKEDQIYIWRGTRFWHLADFPHSPRVIGSGPSTLKWDGFSDNPDAVVIVQEGHLRRGWIFAMFNGHWSSWYPDSKPWRKKAWWGHPLGSLRFGSMMHNGDIVDPLVLGFDAKFIHYYKTDDSQLNYKGSKKLSVTAEAWPQNISAAFRMEDNTVYLFRQNKYCKRKWNCTNSNTNCCKEWKDAKELFGCKKVRNYRGRAMELK